MIDSELASRRPFEKIHEEVKKAFEKDLAVRKKRLVKSIEAIFNMILRDFDSQFVVVENNDPSIKELQKTLREFATEANAKINGSIQLDLARAMNKTK